jgi:hypothetical protein
MRALEDATRADGKTTKPHSMNAAPIYKRRLNTPEFRLLRLPEVLDRSAPIHTSLETYGVGDCPEYETVSYCCGGENGDTELRHPISLATTEIFYYKQGIAGRCSNTSVLEWEFEWSG